MERRKRNKITVIALIAVIAMAAVGGLITGIYYGVNNDRYSGYVLESGTDRPMANVSVTNGRDVVKTDENGMFKLDGWIKQRFITVTIPSGYWTEEYYLEIGKNTDGYDFYLDKKEKDETSHKFCKLPIRR